MSYPEQALQLRTLLTDAGELELSLQAVPVPAPAPDEVVVQVEAAPRRCSGWRAGIGRGGVRRSPG